MITSGHDKSPARPCLVSKRGRRFPTEEFPGQPSPAPHGPTIGDQTELLDEVGLADDEKQIAGWPTVNPVERGDNSGQLTEG